MGLRKFATCHRCVVFLFFSLGLCGKAQADVSSFMSNITGMLMQILIHESGHAAVASYYGWKIDEFRPYPNVCGGRVVGGCVISEPKPSIKEGGTLSDKEAQGQRRAVSAAGSMNSNLSLLIVAPFAAKLNSGSFMGQAVDAMLTYQNYDWVFYTVVDSVAGFKGDWYAVAQTINKPTYYFIPPAALNFWLLKKYRDHFRKNKAEGRAVILPEIYAVDPKHLTLGARLAVNF